uniref:Protein sleepless n=1 Tax=Strigamia maritima TaxID=126957 RepID=T1ILG0_STRMM
MEPKKGHTGTFPANFCLKVIGRDVTTGGIMVIRRCTLDNMDNQCGVFKFDNDTLRGCILTCNYNGCNEAPALQQSLIKIFCWVILILFIYIVSFCQL